MRRAAAVLGALVSAALVSACASAGGSASGSAPGSAPGSASSASPSHAVARSATPGPTVAALPAGAGDPARVPAISDHPGALGRELVAAERAVRAPGAGPSRLLAAARTAQVAYGRLGQHPAWDRTVLRQVPASLHDTVVANLRARRELRAIRSTAPKGRLPAWRIQAAAPAGKLMAWYHAAGARFGIGWQYLAAVNLVETTFGKIHGLSAVGARGPMQFMPATWKEYGAGGNVDDPHDAIFGAARFLAADGMAHGDVAHALFGYNPTMRYVNAVRAIAHVLTADPRSFAGYYRWSVYYPTSAGVLLLPPGFDHRHGISAAAYARAHPERVFR